MKTKIIISILLFFTTLSFSQFNIIVEDSSDNHIYIHSTIEDFGYVLQNGSGDIYGNRGTDFLFTDSLGNIIERKTYAKSGEMWYEGWHNCFIKGNPSVSVLGRENGSYSIPGILVLDNNYDSLFTKTYSFDTIGARFFSINSTYSNGKIISGQKADTSGAGFSYLLKINENFDTLWSKTYYLDSFVGSKIIETYVKPQKRNVQKK